MRSLDDWSDILEAASETDLCVTLPSDKPVSVESLKRFVRAARRDGDGDGNRNLTHLFLSPHGPVDYSDSGCATCYTEGGYLAKMMRRAGYDERGYDENGHDEDGYNENGEMRAPDPPVPLGKEDVVDLSREGLSTRELRILMLVSELCPRMKGLNISHNSFPFDTSWDCVMAHGSLAEACPPHSPIFSTLQELNLENCNIDGRTASSLFRCLRPFPRGFRPCGPIALRTLYLSNNPIGDKGFEALLGGGGNPILPLLDGLHLSNCNISDASMDILVDSLDPYEDNIDMPQGKIIDLSNNQLSSRGATFLGQAIGFINENDDGERVTMTVKVPLLAKLNLSGNSLDCHAVQYVFERLAMRQSNQYNNRALPQARQRYCLPSPILFLDLSRTSCGVEGVCQFLQASEKWDMPIHVSFANNNIGPEGSPRFEDVFDETKAGRRLRHFDISGNPFLGAETAYNILRCLRFDLLELQETDGEADDNVGEREITLILGAVDATSGRAKLEEELRLLRESFPNCRVVLTL